MASPSWPPPSHAPQKEREREREKKKRKKNETKMKENQQCFFFRFGKNGRTVEEKNKKRCDRNRLAARLDGAGDVTGGAGQSAAGDPRRNE